LHALGVDAVSLTGAQAGLRTDAVHYRARILAIEPERVRKELAAGRVVIVAGFQGITEEMDITTLGRGASDLTAVALAAALGASCERYTDVEGVFTADPRIVPGARKLDAVSYEEMLELSASGAKVLMLRSVEFARNHGVRIHVRSASSDAPGTWVVSQEELMEQPIISGIAHDTSAAEVTILGVPDRPGIAARVFGALAEAGVNVDMIVQNVGHGGETDLSFTVPQVELGKAKKTLEPVVRELGARELTTDASVAKVSIVGAGLHNAPGYAARMFGTLADANVNIEMISTSEVRITCMIAEDELETALRALHDAFELERPENIEVAAAG